MMSQFSMDGAGVWCLSWGTRQKFTQGSSPDEVHPDRWGSSSRNRRGTTHSAMNHTAVLLLDLARKLSFRFEALFFSRLVGQWTWLKIYIPPWGSLDKGSIVSF